MVEDPIRRFGYNGIVCIGSSCNENRKAELHCDTSSIEHFICSDNRLVLFSRAIFSDKIHDCAEYDFGVLFSGNRVRYSAKL